MRAIFVQIKCELGKAYAVAQEAADTIEEMSELYSTSGQFDLLGKFYLETDQDVGRFVTERVSRCPASATPTRSSPSMRSPRSPARGIRGKSRLGPGEVGGSFSNRPNGVEPGPGRSSIEPPRLRTTSRTMASPRPLPGVSWRPLRKRSNTTARIWSGTPGPSSPPPARRGARRPAPRCSPAGAPCLDRERARCRGDCAPRRGGRRRGPAPEGKRAARLQARGKAREAGAAVLTQDQDDTYPRSGRRRSVRMNAMSGLPRARARTRAALPR